MQETKPRTKPRFIDRNSVMDNRDKGTISVRALMQSTGAKRWQCGTCGVFIGRYDAKPEGECLCGSRHIIHM